VDAPVDAAVWRCLADFGAAGGDSAAAGDWSAAAQGLGVWRRCLLRGRVPNFSGPDADFEPWPRRPAVRAGAQKLFGPVSLSTMRFPRLVPTALASLLSFVGEHGDDAGTNDGAFSARIDDDGAFSDDDDEAAGLWSPNVEDDEAAEEEAESPALESQWRGVLRAVGALDAVFGDDAVVDSWVGQLGSAEAGDWRRSGFVQLDKVAERIGDISDLGRLVDSLGRRSTADARFSPRWGAANNDGNGPDGAAAAQTRPDDGFDGFHLGRDAGRAAPSEKVLLAAGLPSKLKTLFLAKYAGGSLRTLAPRGFEDGPVVRTALAAQLPRAPRGPLIVCLDTSHSMTGSREILAKATALACVRAANSQKRAVHIMAFSGAHDLASIDVVGDLRTKEALDRLLAFLECQFGGGSDVATPLRRALALLEPEAAAKRMQSPRLSADEEAVAAESEPEAAIWLDADILLVTDGELMDPPVDEATFAALDRLRLNRRLRVCGVLVCGARADFDDASFKKDAGDRDYANAAPGSPLAQLCDDGDVHTFLADHDDLALLLRHQASQPFSEAQSLTESGSFSEARGSSARGSSARGSSDSRRKFSRRDFRLEAHPGTWAVDAWAPATRTYTEDEPTFNRVAALTAAIAHVERGLVERETEARLVVLGALCREHVLLVGPPGTAKSLLCRRLGELLKADAKPGTGGGFFFELALTRFTTPDDVFGPLSLEALQRDEYTRLDSPHFAPAASAIFLDEIFRAGAVLPALLTLLNERRWFDGSQVRCAKLRTAVAATNQLPEDLQLDALYDRFLVRRVVEPVSDDALFDFLTRGDADAPANVGPLRLFDDVELPRAKLSRLGATVVSNARRWLRDDRGATVSDRRLRRGVDLVRCVAAAHGRESVSVYDLLTLKHVLWSDPEDAQPLDRWLFDHTVPGDGLVDPLRFLFDSLLQRLKRGQSTDLVEEMGGLIDAVTRAASEMRLLEGQLNIAQPADQVFLTPDEVARVRLHLAPAARKTANQLDVLLDRALRLQTAISKGEDFPDFDDGDYADADSSPVDTVDGFDLSWSKKVAKSRLSNVDFKKWSILRGQARK